VPSQLWEQHTLNPNALCICRNISPFTSQVVICANYFCEETMNSAGLSYVIEAFPQHMRSRASGAIIAVSRVGGVVGVLAGGSLFV